MPERSEIQPEDLAPWIGWLHLMEVLNGGEDFLYRIFGSEAGGATGHRLHKKRVSDWMPPFRERALSVYRKTILERAPVYMCRFEAFGPADQSTFSRVAVPLGSATSGVSTHVLSFVTKHSGNLAHDCVAIAPNLDPHAS